MKDRYTNSRGRERFFLLFTFSLFHSLSLLLSHSHAMARLTQYEGFGECETIEERERKEGIGVVRERDGRLRFRFLAGMKRREEDESRGWDFLMMRGREKLPFGSHGDQAQSWEREKGWGWEKGWKYKWWTEELKGKNNFSTSILAKRFFLRSDVLIFYQDNGMVLEPKNWEWEKIERRISRTINCETVSFFLVFPILSSANFILIEHNGVF